MTIGETIRTLRKQKGMSMDELSKKLYVARSTVFMWEAGKRKVDVETRIEIADVLDVPEQRLFPEVTWKTKDIAAFTTKELFTELEGRLEELENV